MSLHDIAKHVQSQGRGEDTVLVHMTPKEVGGLQALAKANGGSLTLNPNTGLYEAGFLSSVLPMVAGVATAAFAPELLPLVAGGIGLADYAMTGSIGQGLMAGLGAWSAGSLGAGLGAAGEAGLAQAGGDAATEAFNASQAEALGGGSVIPNATSQISSMPNLTPDQVTNMTGNLTEANAGQVVRGAGAANAAMNVTPTQAMGAGIMSPSAWGTAISNNPIAAAGIAAPLLGGTNLFKQPTVNAPTSSVTTVNQPLQRLSPDYKGSMTTTPTTHYQAQYPNYVQTPYNPNTGLPSLQSPASTIYAADGGLMQGGPVNTDFMGGDMYPQSQIQRSYYATPTQMPTSAQQTASSYEPKTNPLTGELTANMAGGGILAFAQGGQKPAGNKDMAAIDDYAEQAQSGGIASVKDAADKGDWNAQLALQKLGYKAGGGGISDLGSYSDGGRLLKGPGDGVSDDIPAQIGQHQPARLADGEFVIPARIVSELGNGSTDAGAKRLYAMMDRVQAKRKKSIGKDKFAVNSKAEKDLPA